MPHPDFASDCWGPSCSVLHVRGWSGVTVSPIYCQGSGLQAWASRGFHSRMGPSSAVPHPLSLPVSVQRGVRGSPGGGVSMSEHPSCTICHSWPLQCSVRTPGPRGVPAAWSQSGVWG